MKKVLIFVILFTLVFACKKDQFDISNLNNNRVMVLGHGGVGVGKNYPQNTVESILKCLSYGAHGTEMDVQMTKDSVLVAYHDELLETNTNGSGKIYDYNWDEIKNLHYKYPAYTQYSLVRVSDILDNIPNLSTYFFAFDCKNYDPDISDAYVNRYNRAIIRLITNYNLHNNSIVEIKRGDQIRTLPAMDPLLNIASSHIYEISYPTAVTFNLKAITVSLEDITKEQVELAHKNNIWVAVYNLHTKADNIAAFQKNVDMVQTDKLQHALSLK